MKIAVLIPVYNAERYLAECLDSVLAAGRYLESREGIAHQLDIFACDDGSTDTSCAILMEYSLRYAQVHFTRQSNAGVGRTRNRLLDELPSEYEALAFVDSDDYVREPMYARLVEALERTQADVAESGMPGNVVAAETVLQDLSAYWLRRTAPGPWINVVNKLYRRRAIGSIRFREELHFEEDFYFNYEVNAAIKSKVLLPETDYVYRTNAESATRQLDLRRYFESAKRRLELSAVEFLKAGRIPAALVDDFKAELVKDAYRMCLRKNLKKNRNAAEARELFIAASEFLKQFAEEYGLSLGGLKPWQNLAWRAAVKKHFVPARLLVNF